MYIPTYKRVLGIKEEFGDACNPSMSMDEIKKYEDVVTMPRSVTVSDFFTMELTDVAKEMHAANLCVCHSYFSDPIVEIVTWFKWMKLMGS